MENRMRIARRVLLRTAAASSALALTGCDRLTSSDWFRRVLGSAEAANIHAQRLLAGKRAMAAEYSEAEISPRFRSNGTSEPDDPAYTALARTGFADWKLEVGGLVERPASFSLAELRAMPSRTQITRHDCVEGWSCIGKWKGALLGPILSRAGLKPAARYIAFHCADALEQTLDGAGQYYETIDLVDAFHPQTILAYEMNDAPLPVAHGAPLRLRVERQLGYKMAKYVMRIEAIESFDKLGRGRGGFWEDRGYEWYAGI
jgi:DMSO/TMAO reductase YedYZ molybdopterin-dependent catalytic subunit